MELEILAVMGPLKRKKISLSVPFKSTNLLIGKKVARFYCYLLNCNNLYSPQNWTFYLNEFNLGLLVPPHNTAANNLPFSINYEAK